MYMLVLPILRCFFFCHGAEIWIFSRIVLKVVDKVIGISTSIPCLKWYDMFENCELLVPFSSFFLLQVLLFPELPRGANCDGRFIFCPVASRRLDSHRQMRLPLQIREGIRLHLVPNCISWIFFFRSSIFWEVNFSKSEIFTKYNSCFASLRVA